MIENKSLYLKPKDLIQLIISHHKTPQKRIQTCNCKRNHRRNKNPRIAKEIQKLIKNANATQTTVKIVDHLRSTKSIAERFQTSESVYKKNKTKIRS